MDKKIVKRIGAGIMLYMVFASAVLWLYPDSADTMGWEDRQQYNKVQIGKLNLGTPKDHIIDLMGSPDISEAKLKSEDKVQVMFYRTHRKKSDGVTTQDECTPLLFKNDKLIAWGDGTYQNYIDLW